MAEHLFRRKNHRRNFSGNQTKGLQPLILTGAVRRQSLNLDQYSSEQNLFEMSQPGPVAHTPNVDFFNTTLSITQAKELHDLISVNMGRFDFKKYVDDIKYQGFERTGFILAALKQISANQFLRLAILGAIRGANFEKIKDSSTAIDQDLKDLFTNGIIKRKAVRSTDITILRCTASLPQWCVYFMGQAPVQKKVPNLECHASLQFPAAGSLPMSRKVRIEHIKFSMNFSKIIGGKFDENIYMAMMSNPIPPSEIPDNVKMILGDHDPSQDQRQVLEDVKKELGVALTRT